MIETGNYTATVVSHAISETKKGNPQVVVTFTLSDKNGPQKIHYYGQFTEKSAPYTIKNLITCGLKGNNPAGELEIGKQVEIVVEHETGEDGKTRAKVKYINALGVVKNVISPELARVKLSTLEGMVMAARQNQTQPSSELSDDIPF